MNLTDLQKAQLLDITRRHFFGKCALGVGAVALNQMLAAEASAAASVKIDPANPMAERSAPLPAKAKRVIYLFMAGGPSQLELFDDKPKLRELTGQKPPASLMSGK